MTQDVWIVFDGKKNPQWYSVSQREDIAKKRAEKKTAKTWKFLSEGWGHTCLNIDIEIKLRQ